MPAKIGPYCTITDDVDLGENTVVYGYANLYGCRIGADTRVGPFVEIQADAAVGRRVRIQSHTFICSDVTIEDDVFIGHNVSFINDRYPTSPKASAKTWQCESITVHKGASIGSGATILCGVNIGEGSVVGAGSVVTHDVPPHTIVAGVPASVLREIPPEDRWLGGQHGQAAEES